MVKNITLGDMIISSHGVTPPNGEEVRLVTSGVEAQESGRKNGETDGEAVRTNGVEVLGIASKVADKKIMETSGVVDTLVEDIPTVTEAGELEGKVVVVVVLGGQMLIRVESKDRDLERALWWAVVVVVKALAGVVLWGRNGEDREQLTDKVDALPKMVS